MRAGLRWSDGEPFTADDVVFAPNDKLAAAAKLDAWVTLMKQILGIIGQ